MGTPMSTPSALNKRENASSISIRMRRGNWCPRLPTRRQPLFSLIMVLLLGTCTTSFLWSNAWAGEAFWQAQIGNPPRAVNSKPAASLSLRSPVELGLPTAATTGVPKDIKLTLSDGLVVTKPGTVIEGLDIRGQVYIQAENVTLKNCKVTYGGYAPVRISQGVQGVTVQDCIINGLGQGSSSHGITGAGTFLRNDISGVENGINIEADVPTVIRGNYIHDLQSAEDPHYDGIQIFGDNRNVIVEGNTIINSQPGVSAVFVANTFGSVDNIRIANNYLAGGGFPLYFVGTYTSAPMTNVAWEDNYVVKGGWGYEYIRADSLGNIPHKARNIQASRSMLPN